MPELPLRRLLASFRRLRTSARMPRPPRCALPMKLPLRILASCLAIASGTVIAAGPQGPSSDAPAASPNAAQKLARVILETIQSNNERLQGAELSVTRDFRDRSATDATPKET